jgi:hypothetical protein
MKKALFLLLALAICLSLTTIPAFAVNGNLKLDIGKSHFDPGEELRATVSGIEKNYEDDIYLCVFMCKPDFPVDQRPGDDYWWVRGTGESSRVFNVPKEDGTYEIRLYTNGDAPSAATLVSKAVFTVGNTGTSMTMSLNKTVFNVKETVTVTLSGVTQIDSDKQPVVVLAKAGDPHSKKDDNWWWVNDGGLGTRTRNFTAPMVNGNFELRLYANGNDITAASYVTKIDITITGVSAWASAELTKADSLGLIPDSLIGADLTKPITRAEFAAVSVKLHENLTGKKATPAAKNPFTDTSDTEVLKAYALGITAGTSADKFSPNVLLNREQAATMLTRVLKAAYIQGWTLPTDGNYTLNYTKPANFADDAKISDWAKPSVYFMAAGGIISGTGNNNFSPRATTAAEEAANYASATREQALAIAVRMVDNLKDKPLNYN